MKKQFIKLLVLCSLSVVILSTISTSGIVKDSSIQSLIQTNSHGIGG